jgi:hypothetical protein
MVTKRSPIPMDVKRQVLHEAGYRCSVPACHTILTLDMHHCEHVSKDGSNDPSNLLVLCPNCHRLYNNGDISDESIRTWKMFQISLNEALDKNSVEILLALDKLKEELKVSGDGVLECASLVASGFIDVEWYHSGSLDIHTKSDEYGYKIRLTDRGSMFIDAWKRGDQANAVNVVERKNK